MLDYCDMSIKELKKCESRTKEDLNEITRQMIIKGELSIKKPFYRALVSSDFLVQEINNSWLGKSNLRIDELNIEQERIEEILKDLQERLRQVIEARVEYGV